MQKNSPPNVDLVCG